WLGPTYRVFDKELLEELRKLGWVKGENFVIEYQSWGRKPDQIPALAAELARHKVDFIFAVHTMDTFAAKNATSKIPIVFTMVGDPVGYGFVESLARPGGNVTGVSSNLIEITGKALQLLKEAVPGASRIACLYNPARGQLAHQFLEKMQSAAHTLGVKLQSVQAKDPKDFEAAFKTMTREGAQGLVVLSSPPYNSYVPQIVGLALKNQLPMIVLGPTYWPRAGALMSYAPEYPHQYRSAAHLIDKILRGAKPADLPVELPTLYEFVINLKTAKTLGLEIPESLLIRASDVIE
ncbi:MAG: ABC transporter substrate-binding protein, partial [Deltaproteobacteria bacterium]|nr:ABC transporter substrate-binding protein [Deltaproteobacteria bacterium]